MIPTDGLLKESKDAAVPGLTGSLATFSVMAANRITGSPTPYLNIGNVSRRSHSVPSLTAGNFWRQRVNLILLSRVARVARTTAYQV